MAVLDVGCADGQIGAILAEEGILEHVVGIDFSETMLDRCRSSGRYTELLQGDLNYGLPYAGAERFDLAVVCGVLEFVEDAARILRELRSVLLPGGELWVTFEVPIDGTRPELPPSEWKFGRTREEAVALVRGAGYSILSAEERVAYQAVAGVDIDVDFIFIRAALGDTPASDVTPSIPTPAGSER